MATATQRGFHRLVDDPPWVLDDPFALSLVGDTWTGIAERLSSEGARRGRGFVLSRNRYVEERLTERSFEQYVMLGAGLDSFAWRRPDALRHGLRVFEVDHPASAAWKRTRMSDLALPESTNHVFVETDFEQDDLADVLAASGFEAGRPTMFSWLGVAMYLTIEAIETTLRLVASCAPGSEIVWTYWPVPDELDEVDRDFRAQLAERQAETGEPIVTLLTAQEAEDVSLRCGLAVAAHPSAEDIRAAYFAGRQDGLTSASGERLIAGRVANR